MPELPEVETMVRDLVPMVVGRQIVRVDTSFPGCIVYPSYEAFVERVTQQSILSVSRRGKYAIFCLASGDALILHRGMTGSLLVRKPDDPPESHIRIVLHLDSGRELRLNDPRKFGKVYLMDAAGRERPLPWATMGPEPLDSRFTAHALGQGLRGRTALIKPLLLSQKIVAGLGNIYVDEALYRACIHPRRRVHTLTDEEVTRLWEAIVEVLQAAVEGRGTTFSSYTDIEGRAGRYQDVLQVFRRGGQPCSRCGTEIVRFVVGGRGTHICPTCQKGE